jgi:hypothetical protein
MMESSSSVSSEAAILFTIVLRPILSLYIITSYHSSERVRTLCREITNMMESSSIFFFKFLNFFFFFAIAEDT